MIIAMKGLNVANYVDPVIGDIHDESWVERIVVVDGWSSDDTVEKLKRFDKVEIFSHRWEKWYHDQETSQSNIVLSYVPHGQILFILDFDERCSPELKAFLAKVDAEGMPGDVDIVSVSRRSYELMRYPDSPYAMKEEDGFWVISHEIGQYPDYQVRLIRRKLGMHWVNSPHHVMFGLGTLFSHGQVIADVIHYHGKEDVRERESIERQWVQCQRTRDSLGLPADVFETEIKPEYA